MTESQHTAKCVVNHLENRNYGTECEIAVAAYRLGVKNDQIPTMVIAFLKSIQMQPEILECIIESCPEIENVARELVTGEDTLDT